MFLFLILFLFINKIRSCPLTDNYLSRCHCGILTNGESYIKCKEHTLNQIPLFKRSFPYDELILSNNNIKNLMHSSFDNIKTIRRINLENNSISYIDHDLLRLLGNYLEELIITGNNYINSLEFLTRYPLKNLRILKLNKFNLSNINMNNIFLNMTKLEIVYLRSCQLKQIPLILNIKLLDLESNYLTNTINLITSYYHLNLANNFISLINLINNTNLISLNLSNNNLNQFLINSLFHQNLNDLNLSYNSLTIFNFSILNSNLIHLNLNYNYLLSIHLNQLPKNLLSLSINHNLIKHIENNNNLSSLIYLDLSYNQLKLIQQNNLFQKLNYLNLENNPLQCNCHLKWLKNLIFYHNYINASTWTCLINNSFHFFFQTKFQCLSNEIPRLRQFNISYIKISSEYGLLIQWLIDNNYNILKYIQISISKPYYISPKLSLNQTKIFLSNHIKLNQQYHVCLILIHQYSRDKYCRLYLTNKLFHLNNQRIHIKSIQSKNNLYNISIYIMLIGSCIGSLITFLLIYLCFYLCFHVNKKQDDLNSTNNYHTTCSYHHENLSNSTDSSQFDSSLSTTTNFKHIYQTIDDMNLKREIQLFDLWNQSLKQKR